ncbi:MAG: prepilin-type N-terminal cleavage/methylation domain-containing protein [Planctomycetes bacterium]|nr:prepilin-type N-terminal cleavage/methylation domain-containing protein [Planctomycetota bacterium]
MRCRTKLGFTLVELLVVVLILGALAFVAIPRIGQSTTTAKNNACDTNVDLLNSQIELYYATSGTWPAALTDITLDVNYFPDGAPGCPHGTDYVYNTTSHRVAEHDH